MGARTLKKDKHNKIIIKSSSKDVGTLEPTSANPTLIPKSSSNSLRATPAGPARAVSISDHTSLFIHQLTVTSPTPYLISKSTRTNLSDQSRICSCGFYSLHTLIPIIRRNKRFCLCDFFYNSFSGVNTNYI